MKKRILVFIDWYSPGYRAGGPVQSCVNMVDHLKDDFEFSIVTRDTDYTSSVPYDNVKSDSWNKLKSGARVYYISRDQLKAGTISRIIASEKYDAVYLNSMFSYWFTLLPIVLLRLKNKPAVLASRGMLASGALALKSLKKRSFIFIARFTGLYNNVIFQASTVDEAKEISRAFPKARIMVAPNLPKKVRLSAPPVKEKEPGSLSMVNVARISPEKNLLYALQILKDVKSGITFDIYGSVYDTSYYRQCVATANALPDHIRVHFHDAVEPSDISRIMRNADLMFMPTRGENFGHIILEAMSEGCPVLISDKTMFRNLREAGAGYDIPLEEKAGFVNAIEEIAAMSSIELERVSAAAFDLAKKIVESKDSVQKTKALFDKIKP